MNGANSDESFVKEGEIAMADPIARAGDGFYDNFQQVQAILNALRRAEETDLLGDDPDWPHQRGVLLDMAVGLMAAMAEPVAEIAGASQPDSPLRPAMERIFMAYRKPAKRRREVPGKDCLH
jgi:hypothetical protein